jgi:prefoldin subunit 5
MTEQQQHLEQLSNQQKELLQQLQQLNNEVALKKELILKVQGAIEYLQQLGVTIPEKTEEKTEEEPEFTEN